MQGQERRTRVIAVRVNEAEHQQFNDQAQAQGLPLAVWLRMRGLQTGSTPALPIREILALPIEEVAA